MPTREKSPEGSKVLSTLGIINGIRGVSLGDIKLKLMTELLKNSHRSDRELARALGTSQPTVSRTREKLEKEGYINEYQIIPNFQKLGYHLFALTFFTGTKVSTSLKWKKPRNRH